MKPTKTQVVGYGLSIASAVCLVVAAGMKGGWIAGIEAAGYAFGAGATLVGTVNIAAGIAALLPRKT